MPELEGKEAPEIIITTGNRVDATTGDVQEEAGGEKQLTDIEVLAMKMGWNPEHDENSGRAFKPAEQYILDSKQIQDTTVKTLNTLKKSNEELVKGMQNLKTHYNKSAEIERGRIDTEIAALKNTRDMAIEDADKGKVKTVDDQIENLQKSKKDMDDSIKENKQATTASFDSLSKDFMEKNSWYGKNQEMTNYVDAQSERFRGLSDEVYFEKLQEAAMTMFPEAFKGQQQSDNGGKQPAQNRQTVVGGQTRQTGAGVKTKVTFNDLSEEQQKWAKFYDKTKVMTVQEYVDEQVKIGNVPGMGQG